MLSELRSRLGSELDQASGELEARLARPRDAGESVGDARAARRELERRVRHLGALVAGLALVEPGSISAERAGFGSRVHIKEISSGNEDTYVLMVGDLLDIDDGHVSLASPLGQGLLGGCAGDRLRVATPGGERQYEILEVVTLPTQLGISDASDIDAGDLAVRVA